MNTDTVNEIENRGIYQGASVMRMDDRGRPVLLIRTFPTTPEAVAFVEDIYAVTTRTTFKVYESYSYPIGA